MTPTVRRAYAQDHINDVATNSVAVVTVSNAAIHSKLAHLRYPTPFMLCLFPLAERGRLETDSRPTRDRLEIHSDLRRCVREMAHEVMSQVMSPPSLPSSLKALKSFI